ncbi:MAG: TRAP transporter large permease [Clostridia bacterium]
MNGVFILILFLALIVINVPIAFSMMLTGFIYVLTTGNVPVSFVPQAIVNGSSSYTVLAIPFFMLVGELMNSSGITTRLFNFANCLVGHITGGLGHVNVLASILFAGMSGSAAADAAGLGNVEIKAMKEQGFDADFAVGVTAASSTIGPIIPPSSPMVLFGITGFVSIGALFLGGLVAGIMMAVFMMVTVYILAKKRNYPKRPRASVKEMWRSFIAAAPSLLTPIIIVGGILSGIFTPTEAAAASVVYALFLGVFVNRELNLKNIFKVLDKTVENIGMCLFLAGTGNLFGWMLGLEKVAENAANALFSISPNPMIILLIINIFLLFVGTFMETNASIFILVPVLMPIIKELGMHPVQFGVVMVLALMIGLLTPPTAICLSITSKLGGISYDRAFKATTPYYIGLLVTLALLNIFPELTLFIPRLFLGKAF